MVSYQKDQYANISCLDDYDLTEHRLKQIRDLVVALFSAD